MKQPNRSFHSSAYDQWTTIIGRSADFPGEDIKSRCSPNKVAPSASIRATKVM